MDARLLEAALLNLRKRIAAIPLVFQIAGSEEVKIERGKLLSQIDDYLLPRVRRSAAPVLVALVGSTGAGKSTLVNSIVGAPVSATGVRRPTTNSPVLACHPDDIDWFAENNFLPTLPRVRQEGLARPGRDGLLVLAASEGMPRGIALLDTPDIDSVVQAHHEFAYQFLDASDLWLFMTSASRYADGPVWEVLQHARERKASLGVVLSRVPQTYRDELTSHFNAMLDANGIAAENRFVIEQTPLIDGMLPADAYQPVRDWLTETATRADRRVAVLSQTMSGVLDTFKTRVPAIAAHVEAQVVLRAELRRAAETAYQGAFDEAGAGLTGRHPAPRRGARPLGGLHGRRRPAAAARGQAGQERGPEGQARPPRPVAAGRAEYRTAFGRRVLHRVRGRPGGRGGGRQLAGRSGRGRAARRRGRRKGPRRARQAGLRVRLRSRRAERRQRAGRGGPQGRGRDQGRGRRPGLGLQPVFTGPGAPGCARGRGVAGSSRPAHGGRGHAVRGPADLLRRGGAEPGGPGSDARRDGAGHGRRSPAGAPAAESEDGGIYTAPRRMLTSVFGEELLNGLLAKARADLSDRVRLLLDEELVRFVEVIDAAGACDDVAAIRLYQAEFSLEAVR